MRMPVFSQIWWNWFLRLPSPLQHVPPSQTIRRLEARKQAKKRPSILLIQKEYPSLRESSQVLSFSVSLYSCLRSGGEREGTRKR
ncbi:hypothetical protein BJY04DRAFT_192533 [Aspergillus karnatakaensis]|uniref:uncharacterized protein n=1 Tax=Aspergillus karnatakaensis TaxID=1810916 RepID=UPI003CCD0E07